MSRKLTKKQEGFVKDYVKTGEKYKSVLKNFDIKGKDPRSVASAIATEYLDNPRIQEAIKSIAETIPDELLTRKHLQFLNSEKEEIGIKALDFGYKLKGAYAPEKKELSGKIETADDEKLRKMAELLGKQLQEEDEN